MLENDTEGRQEQYMWVRQVRAMGGRSMICFLLQTNAVGGRVGLSNRWTVEAQVEQSQSQVGAARHSGS